VTRLRDVVRDYRAPTGGLPGDPGLFGPGSAVWRLHRERALLLGGGRALLMQLAHPLVAAGVADHSGFDRDPWERLWSTLDAVLTVTFGDREQARAATERVTALHATVVGERDGIAYSALDPELMVWVHATLVDSGLVAYERLVSRLAVAEKERYLGEMRAFAGAFGVPTEAIPSDLGAFGAYVNRQVSELEVSGEARRLALGILRPPVPRTAAPVRELQRLLTVGLLPSRLRSAYGLRWSPGRERAFGAACGCVRGVLTAPLPRRLRWWPHAVEAERRAGRFGGGAALTSMG
jgi:uncharacterized protein (DUF2236 family)